MAGVDLQQNLSQQQILSPQMRQSLEILQANSLELGHILQQAIATNPVIEVTSNSDELLPDDSPTDAEHDQETLSNLDDDFRESRITSQASNGPSQETVDYLYNSIVAPLTLQQHLAEQISNEELSEKLKLACLEIISYIDDRGFLEQTAEQIAITSQHPAYLLEKAVIKIQQLDPAGVGAADLTESLMIQLHKLGMNGSLAYNIVEHHLTDLAQKKFPQIAKELNTSVEKVSQAAQIISNLNPDPGAAYDPTANPYILPDVYLERSDAGEWTARLSNEHVPDIAISNAYKDLMASTADSKARTYLKDRIRDGKIVIRALHQRQDTLQRIALILLDKQRSFLETGMSHLKPLTMNEIAEMIEVHPATISRAVAGKYAMTPHGIIELRQFFTSGFQSADGTQVANSSIKETLQQLVDNEPASKPLSDSAIEKLLKEKGLKVARRTIAKYRDQLGILPSHLRKKF